MESMKIEKEFTCFTCKERFTQFEDVPFCCHHYCTQCSIKLALQTGSDQPFSCQDCRKEVILPEVSVDKLPTDLFLSRLKEVFASLERAGVKAKVKCEGCIEPGVRAEAFCRHCSTFVCKECMKSHQRLKIYLGHEVVSFNILPQEIKGVVMKELPVAENCHLHEEPLIVYCFDCSSLISLDCTATDHRDHKFELCKIAAPKTKKKLLEKLEPLRKVEATLSHALKEVHTTLHEVEAQGHSLADTIESYYEDLRKELTGVMEESKQELLEETSSRVQEKMDRLSLQEKSLSLSSAQIKSILDRTEECVRHHSDNDVMSMHPGIMSRIHQEIEEHSRRERSLEPVEEVDLGVELKCTETLQQFCRSKTIISQLPIDPSKCIVTVEGAKTAEINKICTTDVTLTTKLTNNQPTKRNCEVECYLKCISDGSIMKCNVDQTGARNYSIEYTPTVRGQHELTVLVDGQQVSTAFPILVTISPTQLGRPVGMWGGISMPTCVTINSNGEIIVTERGGDIITFDNNGKKLRSITRKLVSLSDIAVDDEDNIYCTASYTNKILRSDKNGVNVQMYEVKQVKGPGHHGVVVVGEEVMVCELYNKGTIMVYDKELKFVRQIVGEDMGEFRDVSPDYHGNLFVTDWNNSCIRVFSLDGVNLRSFGSDENGVKRLSGPRSVCVADQYVYVTDWGYHNISVFTTEGEYLTSFGQRGAKNPCGVCVDKDFYVYVIDFLINDRVEIF